MTTESAHTVTRILPYRIRLGQVKSVVSYAHDSRTYLPNRLYRGWCVWLHSESGYDQQVSKDQGITVAERHGGRQLGRDVSTMSDKASQESFGDYSPNVNGSNNTLTFDASLKINPAQEVKTMLAVIGLIPVVARAKLSADEISFDYGTKDLKEKFDVRFKEYAPQLKGRIADLSLLYRSSYDEAKNASDIGEFDYEELLDRLRQLSIKAIDETGGNPVTALDCLVSLFEEQFKLQKTTDYSVGAIEYFLYMELMNCNVFPNAK